MFLGVWVNPNLSTAGNDPFRISQEIASGNYSMIWHQLIWGQLQVDRVRGCMFIDEEACFRQTGERAIEWTETHHPDHPEYAEIMRASVANVLAQRSEPPEPPPEPPLEPPPEPPPEPGTDCSEIEAELSVVRRELGTARQTLQALKAAIQAALDAAE